MFIQNKQIHHLIMTQSLVTHQVKMLRKKLVGHLTGVKKYQIKVCVYKCTDYNLYFINVEVKRQWNDQSDKRDYNYCCP